MSKSKILITIAFALFGASFLLGGKVNAQTSTESVVLQPTKLEYVLFHRESCPHCREEIKFINEKLMPKYGQYIDMKMYEVSDPASKESDIFKQFGQYYKVETDGVPMAFIGGELMSGYGEDDTTGREIMGIVEKKLVEMKLISADQIDTTVAEGEKVNVGKIITWSTIALLVCAFPAYFWYKKREDAKTVQAVKK
jgi:hypothetical protein